MLTPLGWITVEETECSFCGCNANGGTLCEECRVYFKEGFNVVIQQNDNSTSTYQ